MLKMNFYRCFLGFGTRLEHVSGVFTVRYSFFKSAGVGEWHSGVPVTGCGHCF